MTPNTRMGRGRDGARLGATVVDGRDAVRGVGAACRGRAVELDGRSLPMQPDQPPARGSASPTASGTATTTGSASTTASRSPTRPRGWQPEGCHGPSAVVDPAALRLDRRRLVGRPPSHDAVLYELHVGTFTPAGTLDAAIDELARLARLGVTHVELMPLNEFPGDRNWGYDGVFWSAVQHTYGGPEALARFVDAAHATGLGVVVDVVYNHVGPLGSVLHEFGPYFTDVVHTPWGDAVNVAGAGSDTVRRTIIESACRWIEDFHVDGLRVDAIHAIHDPTARPFLEQLTTPSTPPRRRPVARRW